MEFNDLIKIRRSTRKYTEERPDHDQIEEILKKAQQAPSWKNLQSARSYVAESPEILEKLRTEGLPEFNRKNSENAVLIVSTFVPGLSGFAGETQSNEQGNAWGAYDLGLHDAYLVLAASYMAMLDGIKEALEHKKTSDELEKSISKEYGEDGASSFVNGVLNSLAKELKNND